jgi:hypothetical protein
MDAMEETGKQVYSAARWHDIVQMVKRKVTNDNRVWYVELRDAGDGEIYYKFATDSDIRDAPVKD